MGSDLFQSGFRLSSDWVQIWHGSGLRRFRLGSDLARLGAKAVQIGFRLASDWVQIGFRLGSDLARLGAEAVQMRFSRGHGRVATACHGQLQCMPSLSLAHPAREAVFVWMGLKIRFMVPAFDEILNKITQDRTGLGRRVPLLREAASKRLSLRGCLSARLSLCEAVSARLSLRGCLCEASASRGCFARR